MPTIKPADIAKLHYLAEKTTPNSDLPRARMLLADHRAKVFDDATCTQLKQQLKKDGYVHIPAAIDRGMRDFFRLLFTEIVKKQQTEAYTDQHKGIGSLFDILQAPMAADLVADPWLASLRAKLGFADAKFTYGLIFNKKPKAPRTFWHQDGTVWNTDLAYQDDAPEILQLHYLEGSDKDYGALRVLPGTHRLRHELHGILAAIPKGDLRSAKDTKTMPFATFPDEITINTKPGDMVLLDARLLHATHANNMDTARMCVTLSYLSTDALANEEVLARYTRKIDGFDLSTPIPYIPKGLPPELEAAYKQYLPPRYSGTLAPLPICNIPR